MKRIYFNLSNGVVVDPTPIPKYMAIVKCGKVIELHTCFRVQNIVDRGGQGWVDSQLDEERKDWLCYPWLRQSLFKYIKQRKHWFKDSNFKETVANRFTYIRFLEDEL